jgi:hypothetical protein
MKRFLRIAALFFGLTLSAGSASAGGKPDLEARIEAINAAVKAETGVSLTALPLIADAGPSGYFPVAMLESSGRWQGFKQLESAGYIQIQLTQGLPDGSNRDMQFAQFVLTESGAQLQAALQASN